MQRKAIFLDRDGVLNAAVIKNGKPYPPASLAEVIIPPEAPQALTMLKDAGFLLLGVTNQPDVARGTTSRNLVEAINQTLMMHLVLDEIRVCFHDDQDHCLCRKPSPGLLLDLANDYCIDLVDSYMIGDRWKDIEAGQRAGCKTIWLDYQYAEKKPSKSPDFTTSTLLDAAGWIISRS